MNDLDRLFESLFRNTIGFDNLRPYLGRDSTSFPRYDVIQIDTNNYAVQLALAGYRPDDIDVFIQENVLHIQTAKYTDDSWLKPTPLPTENTRYAKWDSTGTTLVADEVVGGRNYKKTLHRGIARRDFKLTFALPEHFEVVKAEFDNGLLCVELKRNVPEALAVKKIPITLAAGPSPPLLTNKECEICGGEGLGAIGDCSVCDTTGKSK